MRGRSICHLRDYLIDHPALVSYPGFPPTPDPTAAWGFNGEATVPGFPPTPDPTAAWGFNGEATVPE